MFRNFWNHNYLLVLFFCIAGVLLFKSKSQASSCIVEVPISETIGPGTLDLVQRSLKYAAENKCGYLSMLLNTPGGSLQSTRLIVEEILASSIPVLCLVAPRGGHAGSAGAIILQACHLSGALRTTNIGAATPITSTGQEIPEDLRKKLINDTKSWVEGLTELRKRNKKFGQEIVTEAKAVSAEEAFKIGAIDLLAESVSDFYHQTVGKKVLVGKESQSEHSIASGDILQFQPDLRHQVFTMITDPQIAYMMFMGSIGLIYFEITHPGMMVPGVIGGIGLIVSMMSLHKLNVETGGLALLLLGLILMIAEAFVASFGILGVGGVIAFFLGSLFLFDPHTSGHQIPISIILSTTLVLGLLMFTIAYLAWSTRKKKVNKSQNDLVGKKGVVVELSSKTEGQMEIIGETWRFKSLEEVEFNESIEVTKVVGLTLHVKKINNL